MFFISKFKEKLPYPPISSFPQSKKQILQFSKNKFAVQLKKRVKKQSKLPQN